jgi:hypothetical protein
MFSFNHAGRNKGTAIAVMLHSQPPIQITHQLGVEGIEKLWIKLQ